jgi:hypothetical protein
MCLEAAAEPAPIALARCGGLLEEWKLRFVAAPGCFVRRLVFR